MKVEKRDRYVVLWWMPKCDITHCERVNSHTEVRNRNQSGWETEGRGGGEGTG
jgi:hypothetical protein